MMTNFVTGQVPGVVVSAVAHEAPVVTVNGKPARLVVVDENGQIVADGPEVAREVRNVSVNSFRQALIGKGHIRISGQVGATA